MAHVQQNTSPTDTGNKDSSLGELQPSSPVEPRLLTVTLEFKYVPSSSDPSEWNREIEELMIAGVRGSLEYPDSIPFFRGQLCSWNANCKVTDGWEDVAQLQSADGNWVAGPRGYDDGRSEEDDDFSECCPFCGETL
jgi:hypothetical protein